MKTSLILPMMFITSLAFAGKSISIEDAIKKKLVSASIKGKGGHTGDVIRIKLKNLLNRTVSIDVEAGRRLDSEKQNLQDILVNRAAVLTLLPNQTKTFTISGMCCQAHNSGPDSSAVFSVGKMADTNLVRLARFIDENKWYGDGTAQRAVWIVSDNNAMEGIGGNDTISKRLQLFVSKLTGKPIPEYKIEYAGAQDCGAVFSGIAAKIKGDFEYEIYSNGLVTFGIYDSRGQVVQMFFTDKPRSKGSYVFSYEFNTSNLPKGEYFARFRFDGQVKKEKKFTF
jgi:hypothetical protein